MSYLEETMRGPQVGDAIIQLWKTKKGGWVCTHTAPEGQAISAEATRMVEALVAELNRA